SVGSSLILIVTSSLPGVGMATLLEGTRRMKGNVTSDKPQGCRAASTFPPSTSACARSRRARPPRSAMVRRSLTKESTVLIGVPREIKPREYGVGMPPAGVRALVGAGHRVLVETGAGDGSAITDEAYVRAGATIVKTPADAWGAEMVVKV